MAPTHSRVEDCRNQLLGALRSIDQENGYRTTPRQISLKWIDLDSVRDYPSLALVIGDERISPVNSTWTTTSSVLMVYVFGYFRRSEDTEFLEAKEALIQDVKRALWPLFAAQRNDPENPWVFDLKDTPLQVRRVPDFGLDRGVFVIEFRVLLRNVNEEF